LLKEWLPEYYRFIEKRLGDQKKGKYLCGNKLSIADFHVTGFMYSYILNEDNYLYKE